MTWGFRFGQLSVGAMLICLVSEAGLWAQEPRSLFQLVDRPVLQAALADETPAVLRRQLTAVNHSALSDLHTERELPVRLDLFDDLALDVIFESDVIRAQDSFTLFGRALGQKESLVTLTVEGSEVFASIRGPEIGVFEIRSRGGGLFETLQFGESPIPLCAVHEEVLPDPPLTLLESDPGNSSITPLQDSGAEFDVLFVYTASARGLMGGNDDAVQARVLNIVDTINTLYYPNSQITPRIRTVGIEPVSRVEQGDSNFELNLLLGFNDNAYDEAHVLRDALGADLIVCFANFFPQDAAGRAPVMRVLTTLFGNSAFNIDHPSFAQLDVIVAHELGHNMGCEHDFAHRSGNGVFPHSYGLEISPPGGNRTTQMFFQFGGATIPHFSNPNVDFLGAPTGLANQADNARSINDVATTVANFRQHVLPTLVISDRSLSEGDSGTTTLNFDVFLTEFSSQTVSVTYTTENGSAFAGSDYVAGTDTLVFPPNTSIQTGSIEIFGDTVGEQNETFRISLADADGAALLDREATVTISNDDAVTISIESVVLVDEGDVGTSDALFEVSLSNANSVTSRVDYTTADFSAVAGADYTTTSGQIFFPAFSTAPQTITVPIIGNTVDEGFRVFYVDLSSPVGAVLGSGRSVCGILDDDGPTMSIDDVSVAEGDAGTTSAIFTVSLSAPTPDFVTVDYRATDDTAMEYMDFSTAMGSLLFQPNVTSQTVTVEVIGDLLGENDETFSVFLFSAQNADILDGQGTGTILDNDGNQVTISIGDSSVAEGDAGSVDLIFPVTLSGPVSGTVTVDYFATDNSATDGDDYNQADLFGTVIFPMGSTSQPITAEVFGDLVPEANETFTVSLNTPINAAIDRDTAVGTIIDNDGNPPTLTIDDVAVLEGDAGTTSADFTVTLSSPSSGDVTVAYDAVAITAMEGVDFNTATGSVTFPANTSTPQIITVQVIGELMPENDETFDVLLSNPQNAGIIDGSGRGTITNDDGAIPQISVGSATVVEGDAGTVGMIFPLTVSIAPQVAVMVDYNTNDGTALEGVDYTGTFGTVTFPPGTTTPQAVTVEVIGDLMPEGNETLTLELNTPINGAILQGAGTGTIVDDDGLIPTVSIGDVSATEGDAGTVPAVFSVTLSDLSPVDVEVDYVTADNTATAGSDYTAAAGTVTFPALSVTPQPITVEVLGDTDPEGNELFTVTLSAPVNASIADAQGEGEIEDDELRSQRVLLHLLGAIQLPQGDADANSDTRVDMADVVDLINQGL